MDKENKLWNGFPIESYIGGPLKAVVNSQIMMSKSTEDFIEKIGFEGTDSLKPRNVKFAYHRTSYDNELKKPCKEEVHVEVPLLSLVNVPTLAIKSFNYSFSLDIKTVKAGKPVQDASPDNKSDTDVMLFGTITAPPKQTRQTDQSGTMHLDIQAEQSTMPEGLARIIDLMNQSVTPKVVHKEELPDQDKEQKKDLLIHLIEKMDKEELINLIERLNQSKDE